MKPLFLDCPPRYTRTPREATNQVHYACPMEDYKPPSSYGRAWWVCMILIAVATVFLMGAK